MSILNNCCSNRDLPLKRNPRRLILNNFNALALGVVSFVNQYSGGGDILKLPARDTDGLLVFKLYYYAFGTPESEGVLWTIRNGLYGAAENPDGVAELDGQGDPTGKGATLGSYIPIRFGKGTPVNLQNTTVSIPIGN
jgi:hypothetical protein